MALGFGIRQYELLPDGSIEAMGGGPLDQFEGSCPNVGDTIAKLNILDGSFKFYNVQRRMFIDSADSDEGWAILLRAVEASPLMSAVADEWLDETKFWRDVDEQEREEEVAKQERLKQQEEDRKKHAPRHSLHPREVRALRFMIEHPERNTVDLIPQAAEYTINVLATAGLIRSVGKDLRGLKTWKVTKEGKAEIDRHDKWTRVKSE